MLQFDANWLFKSPGSIPEGIVEEFFSFIKQIAGQGDPKIIVEDFKTRFSGAPGWSSDLGWAWYDLRDRMNSAAENAPRFIDAFYTGCSVWEEQKLKVPPLKLINKTLAEHKSGYQILPPNLVASGMVIPSTDAIECFKQDETLNELVASIERHVAANKPSAALDHLHTYCMKKFAHLLEVHGETCEWEEPLHSRVGKYVKALERRHSLRDTTRQILKNFISIMEKFNHLRNHESLAHDNKLPNSNEARLIFEVINSILRFVKSIEAERFDA